MQRTRFNDIELETARDNAAEIAGLMQRVIDGEISLSKAGVESGVNTSSFRRMLTALTTMKDSETASVVPCTSEKKWYTPEERFYTDYYRLDPYDWDTLYSRMPHDADKVLEWICGGADGFVRADEANVLKANYLDKKSLRVIGEEKCVSGEYIRACIDKTMKRIRRPGLLYKVIRYGMEIYSDAFAQFKIEKETRIAEVKRALEREDEVTVDAFELSDRVKRAKERFGGLDIDISVLKLSVRADNALRRAKINTVRALLKLSKKELSNIPGIGPGMLYEIYGSLDAR